MMVVSCKVSLPVCLVLADLCDGEVCLAGCSAGMRSDRILCV